MLLFLRKVLGLAALAWLSLCLRCLITFYVNPTAAGIAFLDMVFTSYVGVPAGIIWAVLKVISVLNARPRGGTRRARRRKSPQSSLDWRRYPT